MDLGPGPLNHVKYFLNILSMTISLDWPSFMTRSGIYPSSFTNVRFRTKIEFSNVAKCRWGSQGAVSSAMGSKQSLGRVHEVKPLKNFWPFYIWRTNKQLKMEGSYGKLMYFECMFNVKMLQNKIVWRLNLKTQLEDWVFCSV